MPQYCYQCAECDHEFEEWHSIKEKLEDCPQCKNPNSLFRVPFFKLSSSEDKEARVGSLVKKHIEEAKEEIKKDKADSMKEITK